MCIPIPNFASWPTDVLCSILGVGDEGGFPPAMEQT